MRRVLVVVAVLLGLAVPARADALFVFLVDANTVRGHVSFTAIASNDYTHISVSEGGRPVTVFGPLQPVAGTDFGTSIAQNADTWLCSRRDRRYSATATDAQGHSVTQRFEVRLPSCADRVRMTVPARVGRRFDVTVTDAWGAGDVPFRLCLVPRGQAPWNTACRRVRIPAGARTGAVTLRAPHAGQYMLRLTRPGERLERPVAVGARPTPAERRVADRPVILATGDSLMQSVGVQLHDVLGPRADVYDDVFVGTEIVRPFLVDWHLLPAYQTAVYHPDEVVVLLGANDRYAIGDTPCCGPDWVDLYTDQVRGVMQAYARGGRTKVVYMTVPYGSDGTRNENFAAVNTAIRRAARGVAGVRVLDIGKFFTPGGLFQDVVRWHGRNVDARVDDGQHFTIAGARIAAELIAKAL